MFLDTVLDNRRVIKKALDDLGEEFFDSSLVLDGLRSAKCFLAQNVWENTFRYGEIPRMSYPASVPPFPCTWVEWEDQKDAWYPGREGALVLSYETKDESREGLMLPDGQMIRWALKIIGFREFSESGNPKNKWIEVVFLAAHFLDFNGETLWHEDGTVRGGPGLSFRANPRVGQFWSSYMSTILKTFSLCNCKNVRMREEKNAYEGRINRIRKAQKKPKMHRYHVLEIRPVHALSSGGQKGGSVGEYSLHICRGHFKDYREHGLFGKEKGVYWWDAHVRGKAENGIVEKDYRVLTE